MTEGSMKHMWVATAVALALLSAPVVANRTRSDESQSRVAVSDAQISPDGRTVVFSRGQIGAANANLWWVSFAGGESQRLTSGDTEHLHPRWSPDGRQIAFLSRPGSGRRTLLIIAASGGAARTLGDEQADVVSFQWAPDGRRIAYIAGAAPAETGQIRIVDLATGRAESLQVRAADSAAALSWSPDSSAIAAVVAQPVRRLIVFQLRGAAREIVAAPQLTQVAWSPDGGTVAWLVLGDANDHKGDIFVSPATGGTARAMLAPGDGSPLHVGWTGAGRLSISLAAFNTTFVDIVDPRTGYRVTVLPPGIAVVVAAPSWSADGTRFAVAGSAPDHPAEVFGGSLPLPIPAGRDFVGAPPPPVRRITFSNP